MRPLDRVKLFFGRYRMSRFKYGDIAFCECYGQVELIGMSSGRIPWPVCRRGKHRTIALLGDLVKAVRMESSVAIQYWWGVGNSTVGKWRKILGVPTNNPGTIALKGEHGKELADRRLSKAWAKLQDPVRCTKISAAQKGRRPPEYVLQALQEARRKRKTSSATRRKLSATHRRLGTRPPHGRVWTPVEDALLRSLRSKEVAQLTDRSLASVCKRRRRLRLPDGRRHSGGKPKGGPWTEAEDQLLRQLTVGEVAKRTGRSPKAIYLRRRKFRFKKFPDGRKNNGRRPRGV